MALALAHNAFINKKSQLRFAVCQKLGRAEGSEFVSRLQQIACYSRLGYPYLTRESVDAGRDSSKLSCNHAQQPSFWRDGMDQGELSFSEHGIQAEQRTNISPQVNSSRKRD